MSEWIALTDREIEEIEMIWSSTDDLSTFADVVRLIENKLREKNT